MANKTHLFLLGGSPAYAVYADEFVAAAGGCNAIMAVLAQTRMGWEKYKVEITKPWIDRKTAHYFSIIPDENGVLDEEAASLALHRATGILICGGHTPTYHQLFASEPLRSIIRQKYQAGVPVAGISAGALISLEFCQLTCDETNGDGSQIVRGLDLARGFVIGVHYTENNALPEVLDVMTKTKTKIGFGIDEPACVVCEDGKFARVLGRSVFRIEMADFEKKLYQIDTITGN